MPKIFIIIACLQFMVHFSMTIFISYQENVRIEIEGCIRYTGTKLHQEGMTMSLTTKVNVRIESKIDEESAIEQNVEGELYPKGSHYYLRYKEPDPELAGTTTLIKLESDLVRIIRQGSLRSEQTFKAGQRLRGYYDAPHGKLELETDTEWLKADLMQGLGTVEWGYELYVMEQRAGAYRLRLTISAGPEAEQQES
jgi:uncharacterized beta-barrel protein YwiB (DUF1934 family)